jgi:hypothetical protein
MQALFRRAFTVQQWNIGLLDSAALDPFARHCAASIHWYRTNTRVELVADPFLLQEGNELFLLAEYREKPWQPAAIAAWKVGSNGELQFMGVVIQEKGVHLSYPFAFRYKGEIYCMPERSTVGSPILYRARSFPVRWQAIGELLPGHRLADPTIVNWDSRWWLFCTTAEIDGNGAMEVWYAQEPTGEWRPHARNPVKRDRGSARGAGPCFVHQENLIRPAQDCSVSYGARVVFNRVKNLTPTEFDEETVGELCPDPSGAYPDGLHTLTALDGVQVVDGKRFVRHPLAWYYKVRVRMRLREMRRNEASGKRLQGWTGNRG